MCTTCIQHLQIKSSSSQMTFNTLKNAQMHSSHTNTRINTFNVQIYTYTPQTLQSPNFQHINHELFRANTRTERHMNNVSNEMTSSIFCHVLVYTFPPSFIQYTWNISTPTSHKAYGFFQTLFTFKPLTITFL